MTGLHPSSPMICVTVVLVLLSRHIQATDFALVREESRLNLEVSDNSSEFDIVTGGSVVVIEPIQDNCTTTTYKQSNCNFLTGGVVFDTYINAEYSTSGIGDGTVVVGDNKVAICGRIALRTLCPTNATTIYEGSNNLYSVVESSNQVSVIPTFGSKDWCVGVCVVDEQYLCFKFESTNRENCTYNGWLHIAPSLEQSDELGVACNDDVLCSAGTKTFAGNLFLTMIVGVTSFAFILFGCSLSF